MIPKFDSDGDLPPGKHKATLAEIEKRLAKFITSDRRIQLFGKLKEFVKSAKNLGIIERIFIVGSFVTAKPEPQDIDMLVVFTNSLDLTELNLRQYNILHRRAVRRTLGTLFDIYVVRDGSEQMNELIRFFQTNRDGKPVGIVEVTF